MMLVQKKSAKWFGISLIGLLLGVFTFGVFARKRPQAETCVHELVTDVNLAHTNVLDFYCTRLDKWAPCIRRNIATKKTCKLSDPSHKEEQNGNN